MTLFAVVAVRAGFEPLRVVRLAQNTKPRMNVVSRYGTQKTANDAQRTAQNRRE